MSLMLPILSISTLILFIGFSLTTWKMFEFKRRFHQLISNVEWENVLSAKGMYNKNKIVLFGDSQIELWWLCPFFGIIPIKNKGVSGERADEAIKRFKKDVLNLNAKIVVIITGANDLIDGRKYQQIAKDIEKMILMANEHSISVVVGSLLPFKKDIYGLDRLTSVQLLNNKIKALAQKNNAEFIDFFSILSDGEGFFQSELTDDGQHPNFNGYFKMSSLLLNSLKNHL